MAFEVLDKCAQARAHQAGTAAEIDRVSKSAAGRHAADCSLQQFRHAIAKRIDQRMVKLVGILVEQGFDKGARRRFGGRDCADKLQLERRARAIRRLQLERHAPRLLRFPDSACRLLELAQPVPSHCPLRREFERPQHQLRRCRMVTIGEQHLGIVGAAVGDQVAGGGGQGCHGEW